MRSVVVITASDGTVSVAGSFNDPENADRIADAITRLGLDAIVCPIENPGKVLAEIYANDMKGESDE